MKHIKHSKIYRDNISIHDNDSNISKDFRIAR